MTIIIFTSGLLLGNRLAHIKLNKVVDLSENLQIDTMSIEVEYDILKENICKNNILFLTDELFDLSTKLDYMENSLGYDNPKIKELKTKYFILEAKHWLLAKQRFKTCFNNTKQSINNTIILYFYSNKGDCKFCNQESSVISFLHKKYSNMKVYSFDINSRTPAVKVIKKLYTINNETLPALVINDVAHQGFLDKNQLVNFVNSTN